jgi:hypothetical protein
MYRAHKGDSFGFVKLASTQPHTTQGGIVLLVPHARYFGGDGRFGWALAFGVPRSGPLEEKKSQAAFLISVCGVHFGKQPHEQLHVHCSPPVCFWAADGGARRGPKAKPLVCWMNYPTSLYIPGRGVAPG